MEFSVVIPVYNNEKLMEECLKAWENQTFNDYEVIIVDDMSTDATPKIIKEFLNKTKKKEKFRYIRLEKKGFEAGARERGAKEAKGKYIVQTDADAIYDKDYLKHIHDKIKGHECAIPGYFLPINKENFGKFWYYKRLSSYICKLEGKKKPTGINVYSKEIFNKLKEYDKSYRFGTDMNFSDRILKLGCKPVWIKEAYFLHDDPDTLRGTFSRLCANNKYGKKKILESKFGLLKRIFSLFYLFFQIFLLLFPTPFFLVSLILPTFFIYERRKMFWLALEKKDYEGLLYIFIGNYLILLSTICFWCSNE